MDKIAEDKTCSNNCPERTRIIYGHIQKSKWCLSSCKINYNNNDNSDDTDKVELKEKKKKKPKTWLDVLQMDPKLYWPKKYRYTYEPRAGEPARFSTKQRDFYEANGYIVIKNLVPNNTITKLQKISSNNHFSHKSNAIISKFISFPQLVKYVQGFVGPNIMCINSYIDDGIKSTQLYQDLYCLPIRPADKIVSTFTALNNMHENNGFFLIPESHKASYLETINTDSNGIKTKMIYEPLISPDIIQSKGKSIKLINLDLGDTIFYHPLIYHDSISNTFRPIGINCQYASSECQYVTMSSEHLHQFIPNKMAFPLINSQEKMESDMMTWKNNVVLIKGVRINL